MLPSAFKYLDRVMSLLPQKLSVRKHELVKQKLDFAMRTTPADFLAQLQNPSSNGVMIVRIIEYLFSESSKLFFINYLFLFYFFRSFLRHPDLRLPLCCNHQILSQVFALATSRKNLWAGRSCEKDILQMKVT